MQDSDENWIWWPREEWKSEMCKPKYQEKMTVLFMVDECFGQDFRSRSWFWPLWGAVLDFHQFAQKMHSGVLTWAEGKMTLREWQGERITTAEEPEGRRTRVKIVRGKDISKLERMEREVTGHLEVKKAETGSKGNWIKGNGEWGQTGLKRWNQWASFLVSWMVAREEGEAGRVKDRVNGFQELLMKA